MAIAMKRMFYVYLVVASVAFAGCADVVDTGLTPSKTASAVSDELPKFKHAELLDRQGISVAELKRVRRQVDQGDSKVEFSTATAAASPDSVDLIVALPEGSDEVTATKMMRRYKMFRRYDFSRTFNGVAVRIDVDDLSLHLDEMQTDPDIDWFEPDLDLGLIQIGLDLRSLLPLQETPWGIEDIGADVSSARSGNGYGRIDNVNMFILDSGSGSYDNNVGLRLENYSSSLVGLDLFGHGAHVTSTAVGSDNLLGFVGVAPGVKTYSLKVLDDFGNGSMASVIEALDRVSQIQENSSSPGVVNLSLGAYVATTEYTALDHAIDNLVDQGIVVVVAAGNEGTNAGLVSPAHAVGAITVGAYDQNHALASFSNYGNAVDILAPGVDILAVGSLDPIINGAVMSGTSMAAPHVAGAAALYLSQNPGATPRAVRKALIKEARPIVTGTRKHTTTKALWVGNF